jgi:hypothetical protein
MSVIIKDIDTMKRVREILKKEMHLKDDRIFYYNQDYVLPQDKGLWVVIGFAGARPYANRNSTGINKDGNFEERQNVNSLEQIMVHLMSYNLEAYERRYDVPLAIASIYAQQKQSEHGFRIARNPIGPIDASAQEGPEINYRFDWTLNVLVAAGKIKSADFIEGDLIQVTVADGSQKNMQVTFDATKKPAGIT